MNSMLWLLLAALAAMVGGILLAASSLIFSTRITLRLRLARWLWCVTVVLGLASAAAGVVQFRTADPLADALQDVVYAVIAVAVAVSTARVLLLTKPWGWAITRRLNDHRANALEVFI